ncbi:MAG: hypothetical protein JRN58_05370 [Nitrososphaerota archaeon]|nr:hypothetical protein [Nitrososphaerota archaeon]MDG6978494.1 hypothetical protein [Nitrososphaerota archaeon]
MEMPVPVPVPLIDPLLLMVPELEMPVPVAVSVPLLVPLIDPLLLMVPALLMPLPVGVKPPSVAVMVTPEAMSKVVPEEIVRVPDRLHASDVPFQVPPREPAQTVEPSDVVIEITLWACAAGGAATTAKTMKEEARRRKRTRGEDGFVAMNMFDVPLLPYDGGSKAE